MATILNDVCVLVTAAFAHSCRALGSRNVVLLSGRDQGTALLVFLLLGLVGRLHLVVQATGPWIEMSVSDDGQGVPSTEVEQLFFAERPRVHALVLLRRRLEGLFGRSFQLEVRSEIGEGTTVTIRIPLRKQFGVGPESPGAISAEAFHL